MVGFPKVVKQYPERFGVDPCALALGPSLELGPHVPDGGDPHHGQRLEAHAPLRRVGGQGAGARGRAGPGS